MGSGQPSLDVDAAIERAWEIGELSWLLHDDARGVYDQYRKWEKQPTKGVDDGLEGAMRRIFLLDCGRRYTKTTICFVIQLEDVIKHARVLRYTSAYQKDIEEIVDDVAGYVLETCPEHLRPEFKLGSKARPSGWYFPNSRGMIKTVGLDQNPNGLRGRASDGDIISEAAFIRHLRRVVRKVLYPQYQGRPWARMILESSAPDAPETEYDTLFVADAKRRGAYVYRTIEDNPLLDQDEIDEFNEALGGKDSPECQQENYNIRVRDPESHVIPEFDRKLHVREVERPEWFDGYIGMDAGLQDLMAVVGCYLHPETKELVVEDEWAQRNASTGEVAEQLTELEKRMWDGVQRWDLNSRTFKDQPYRRISDTDMRLIYDLNVEHGFDFDPVDRARKESDGRTRRISEAMIHAVRNAFREGWIVVHPRCEQTIAHLLHAKWNDRRLDWERHDVYGHYDLVAALSFVVRHVERNREPIPPPQVLDSSLVTFRRPKRMLGEAQVSDDVKGVLNKVTGGKKSWQNQRVRRRR